MKSCHPDNMQSVDNENYQHFIFYYTATVEAILDTPWKLDARFLYYKGRLFA